MRWKCAAVLSAFSIAATETEYALEIELSKGLFLSEVDEELDRLLRYLPRRTLPIVAPWTVFDSVMRYHTPWISEDLRDAPADDKEIVIGPPEYALVTEIQHPNFAKPSVKVVRQFDGVLTCLRLLRGGVVKAVHLAAWETNRVDEIIIRAGRREFSWPFNGDCCSEHATAPSQVGCCADMGWIISPYGPPLSGPFCEFKTEDIPELLSLINAYESLPDTGTSNVVRHIRTATVLFNQSYDSKQFQLADTVRIHPKSTEDWYGETDRFLRLWMSLEALVGRREDENIGASLTVRASKLTEASEEQFRSLWRLRSDIVHGNALYADPRGIVLKRRDARTMLSKVNELERLVRKALCLAIKSPDKLERVIRIRARS